MILDELKKKNQEKKHSILRNEKLLKKLNALLSPPSRHADQSGEDSRTVPLSTIVLRGYSGEDIAAPFLNSKPNGLEGPARPMAEPRFLA